MEILLKWWEEQDSNLRSPKATDLQSVAFDRSAIFPTICYILFFFDLKSSHIYFIFKLSSNDCAFVGVIL